MFFFHVLLLQHGCSENTPYDFFKRKLSLVGGDNQGHLHENIAPGAGTFTYFLQPISPSPRLCPGWGDRGFTLTGALPEPVSRTSRAFPVFFLLRTKGIFFSFLELFDVS